MPNLESLDINPVFLVSRLDINPTMTKSVDIIRLSRLDINLSVIQTRNLNIGCWSDGWGDFTQLFLNAL